VIVSVAIGAIILSGAMTLYSQGNKYFYKVTEHSSFRSEALWMLERIEEDLNQLQVDTGQWPDMGGGYYLLQPYKLTNAEGTALSGSTMMIYDSEGNPTGETVNMGQGLAFHRFHHIASAPASSGLLPGAPQMEAHRIKYTQGPVDDADPSKGVNLYRNGRKINHVPLKSVIFHQQPLVVAAGQLHATKHSVLTCSIVPLGGTFGTLATNTDFRVMERLERDGSITARTFHLAGFESFYTSILVSEVQRRHGGGSSAIQGMDALHDAVYGHASANVASSDFNAFKAEVTSGGSPPTHNFPPGVFTVKNIEFQDDSSSGDGGWLDSPVQPGKASVSGEWEIPPGSGSGSSGSETPGSGSSG
jgi:hypothetical protein